MRVHEIMNRNVKYVSPSSTIFEVMNYMKINNLRIIQIIENEKLLGIITEHDIFLLLTRNLSTNIEISKVMKKFVITINDNDTIEDAADLMGMMQIERLIVINELNKVVGTLSIYDVALHPLCEDYALQILVEFSQGVSTQKPNYDIIYQNDTSLLKEK